MDTYTCLVHNVPMLVTHSGLQHVCPRQECDEHVRAEGPRKEDEMVKKDNTNEERKAAIEAAARKAKEKPSPAPTPAKKSKPDRAASDDDAGDERDEKPKKAKREKDPNMLSVSDVARACGIEPKVARAKLRKDGSRAPDGRWGLVKRDSKEHKQLVSLFTPAPESDDDEEDTDDDSDE